MTDAERKLVAQVEDVIEDRTGYEPEDVRESIKGLMEQRSIWELLIGPMLDSVEALVRDDLADA